MLDRFRKLRGEEGFTLIELLIAIVILAVLAGIVVFAVGGLGDKGQASACNTEAKTIITAEEAYYAKQAQTGPGAYGSQAQLVTGKFLQDDPSWFTVAVQGTGYDIVPVGTTCSAQEPDSDVDA